MKYILPRNCTYQGPIAGEYFNIILSFKVLPHPTVDRRKIDLKGSGCVDFWQNFKYNSDVNPTYGGFFPVVESQAW